jgi:hypothetical protein
VFRLTYDPEHGQNTLHNLWMKVIFLILHALLTFNVKLESELRGDRFWNVEPEIPITEKIVNSRLASAVTNFMKLLLYQRISLRVVTEWYDSLMFNGSMGAIHKSGDVDAHFLQLPELATLLWLYKSSRVSNAIFPTFLF